ncbi:hypothetical protein E2C01_014746 [Portunus trituberculatus]|uniref:Uncharacterized protein n=1 Tax=Portunus trituberculatus TaxID=210409 RepID=A0A5B7DJX4_PORTR|nr:hypothetical protein [Portunus trituberculatus]
MTRAGRKATSTPSATFCFFSQSRMLCTSSSFTCNSITTVSGAMMPYEAQNSLAAHLPLPFRRILRCQEEKAGGEVMLGGARGLWQ